MNTLKVEKEYIRDKKNTSYDKNMCEIKEGLTLFDGVKSFVVSSAMVEKFRSVVAGYSVKFNYLEIKG